MWVQILAPPLNSCWSLDSVAPWVLVVVAVHIERLYLTELLKEMKEI